MNTEDILVAMRWAGVEHSGHRISGAGGKSGTLVMLCETCEKWKLFGDHDPKAVAEAFEAMGDGELL